MTNKEKAKKIVEILELENEEKVYGCDDCFQTMCNMIFEELTKENSTWCIGNPPKEGWYMTTYKKANGSKELAYGYWNKEKWKLGVLYDYPVLAWMKIEPYGGE